MFVGMLVISFQIAALFSREEEFRAVHSKNKLDDEKALGSFKMWNNFYTILTNFLAILDFSGHLVHYLFFVHMEIEKNWPLAYCILQFDKIHLVL